MEHARVLAGLGVATGQVTSPLIARWEEALSQLSGAGISLATAGGSSRKEVVAAYRAEANALCATLGDQLDFLRTCAKASPFSLASLARARALHAGAAARLLSGLPVGDAAKKTLLERADGLNKSAAAQRAAADGASGLLEPADVARKCGLAPRFWLALRLESLALGAAQSALKSLFKSGGAKATASIVLRELRAARRDHPDDPVLRAMPLSGWDRLRRKDKVYAKMLLKQATGVELNTRKLPPVTEGPVLLPTVATTAHRLTCRQTEGSALTTALAASYAADGIQRSNCHDIAQPLHARTLFHSQMEDRNGEELLSLVRHGVLSASAFTAKGVKKVSAELLGAAVKKLNTDLLGVRFQEMSDLAAGQHLRSRAGKRLLDGIRHIANQNAAREAAAAAVSTFSPSELARIHDEVTKGKVPSVRLTSVSAPTPDGWRKGATANERRMWADQYAAWQAVRGEQAMQVPVLDEHGKVQRDADGRAVTREVRVKLEVAAFNFAVNEFATTRVSNRDYVSGREQARRANDEGMKLLLGDNFAEGLDTEAWRPGGWLGDKLPERDKWTPHHGRVVELAKQVADMYAKDNYLGTGKDPYAMVSRLVVLGHEASRSLLNCKSGKDRTTEGETQARALAFDLRQEGELPKPHQPHPDPLAGQRLWNLHRAGGGREVQERATGYAGTKLKHPTVFKQYGFSDGGVHNFLARALAYMGASFMVSN